MTCRQPNSLGPIPACAGEPQHALAREGPDRAYPRLRGGTENLGLSIT